MRWPKLRGRTSPAAGVTTVWWSARRAKRPARVFQPEEERPKRNTCSSTQRRSSSTRWDQVQSNNTTPLLLISPTCLQYCLPAIFERRCALLLLTASRHQVPLLGPGGGGLLSERQVVVRRRPHEAVQDSDADTSGQDACRHGQTQGEPDCVNFQINTRLLYIHTHTHTEALQVHGCHLLLDSRRLIIVQNQCWTPEVYYTLLFLILQLEFRQISKLITRSTLPSCPSMGSITRTWTEMQCNPQCKCFVINDHDGKSVVIMETSQQESHQFNNFTWFLREIVC